MYEMTRHLPLPRLLLEQGPAVAVSIVIAELFYKLHSFSLECLMFLATWYLVDAAFGWLRRAAAAGHGRSSDVGRGPAQPRRRG